EHLPDDAAVLAAAAGFRPVSGAPAGTWALPDHWATALRGRRAQQLAHAAQQEGHRIEVIDEHPAAPSAVLPFDSPTAQAEALHAAATAVTTWAGQHLAGKGTTTDDDDWSSSEQAAWDAARTALASLTGAHTPDTAPSGVEAWRELLAAAEALDAWNHLAPASRASADLIEALDLYLARHHATPGLDSSPPADVSTTLHTLLTGDDVRAVLERPTATQRRRQAVARAALEAAPDENGPRRVYVDSEPTGYRLVEDLHGFVLHHDSGTISDAYDSTDDALYDAVRATDLQQRAATGQQPVPQPAPPAPGAHTTATVVRWNAGPPQNTAGEHTQPVADHPGYQQHTDPDTGVITVFAQDQLIGRAEPFTNAKSQTRYRPHLGDDPLFNGRSPRDAIQRIVTAHAALTGPCTPREHEPVWIEHHEQATCLHGTDKSDVEANAALQLAGGFRPIYTRASGLRSFQHWAMLSKRPLEERTAAVDRLLALMSARGRTLTVTAHSEPTDTAAPASATATAPRRPAAAESAPDTSQWPEGAEPVPGCPGYWLWWEPGREFDPNADYHDFTRYVRIGHGAATIAQATSPRRGKKWSLDVGGDYMSGGSGIEATAQAAVRHWELLHAPAAQAVAARDTMWVEHNETTTIVHGFRTGDEQAWAALRLADFGRVGKSDTIGLRRIRGKEMHFHTRSHKTSLLVGALARVGRIVDVHATEAERTASLDKPEPAHLTAQDYARLGKVLDTDTARRWSMADIHPGDEVFVRAYSYWQPVQRVETDSVVTSSDPDLALGEILAYRRDGHITRADTPPSSAYARPMSTPLHRLEDEEIAAELDSLARPAARPEHHPLITRRRTALQAEAGRRRERATKQESKRALFAQALQIPGALEQAGARVLHDEEGTLLGAVVSEGRSRQFINRDGYLRGHPQDSPDLAQDELFAERESLEDAAPAGWRPAALATLNAEDAVCLPTTYRTFGSKRVKAEPRKAGAPFTYTGLTRSITGEVTLSGHRDGQPVDYRLTPDDAALGVFRPATGEHAYSEQHRVIRAARTRVCRALSDASPIPLTGATAWKALAATAAEVLRRPVSPADLAQRLPRLQQAVEAFASAYVQGNEEMGERFTALATSLTSVADALSHRPAALLDPRSTQPPSSSEAATPARYKQADPAPQAHPGALAAPGIRPDGDLPAVHDEFTILYATSKGLLAAGQTSNGGRDTTLIHMGQVLAEASTIERMISGGLLAYRELKEITLTPAGRKRLIDLSDTARPEPAVGDRVLLAATGDVAIVCGYRTDDHGARLAEVVRAHEDGPQGPDCDVSPAYLTVLQAGALPPQDAQELYRIASLREGRGTLTDPALYKLALDAVTTAVLAAPEMADAAQSDDVNSFVPALAVWATRWTGEQWADDADRERPDWVDAFQQNNDEAIAARNSLLAEAAAATYPQLRKGAPLNDTDAAQPARTELDPPMLTVSAPDTEVVPSLGPAEPYADSTELHLHIEALATAYQQWSNVPWVQLYLAQDKRRRPEGFGTPANPIAELHQAYVRARNALRTNAPRDPQRLLQLLYALTAWSQALVPALEGEVRQRAQQLADTALLLAARSQATIAALASSPPAHGTAAQAPGAPASPSASGADRDTASPPAPADGGTVASVPARGHEARPSAERERPPTGSPRKGQREARAQSPATLPAPAESGSLSPDLAAGPAGSRQQASPDAGTGFPAELHDGESARPGDGLDTWIVTSSTGKEFQLSGFRIGAADEWWLLKELPLSPGRSMDCAPDHRTPGRIMEWIRTDCANRTLSRERAERHPALPPESIAFTLEPVVTQLEENYWRVTRYGVEGRVSKFHWGYVGAAVEKPVSGGTPTGRGMPHAYTIWNATVHGLRAIPVKEMQIVGPHFGTKKECAEHGPPGSCKKTAPRLSVRIRGGTAPAVICVAAMAHRLIPDDQIFSAAKELGESLQITEARSQELIWDRAAAAQRGLALPPVEEAWAGVVAAARATQHPAPGGQGAEPRTRPARRPAPLPTLKAVRSKLQSLDDHRARFAVQALDLGKAQLIADGTFLLAKSTSTHSRVGIRHKGRWYIVHPRTAAVLNGFDGDTSKAAAITYARVLATATGHTGKPIAWGDLDDYDAVVRARTETYESMESLLAREYDRQAEEEDAQRAGDRNQPHAFRRRADLVAHWQAGGRYPKEHTGTGAYMRYWSSPQERSSLHLSADGQFALQALRTGWEVRAAGDPRLWTSQSLTFNSRTRAQEFAQRLAALRRADGSTVLWAAADLTAELRGFVSEHGERLSVAVLRCYAETYADGKGIPQGIKPAEQYQKAADAAANNGAGRGKKFAEDIQAGDHLHGALPRQVLAVDIADDGRRRISTADGAAEICGARDTLKLFEGDLAAARAAQAFDGTSASRVHPAELTPGATSSGPRRTSTPASCPWCGAPMLGYVWAKASFNRVAN
ncbi:hypothetical protein AB0B67_42795, partial [Streptomyces spectabilis]